MVLDASAAVEHVLGTDAGRQLAAVVTEEADLHAPAVCDVEVGSALRRLVLAGALSPEEAGAALEDHADRRIVRHDHRLLLHPALRLRDNFAFADALYVSLAYLVEAPLVTADRALARAARGYGIEVVEPA